MKTTILTLFIVFLLGSSLYSADKKDHYEVSSPDKKITLTVRNNVNLQWAVTHDGQTIIEPSSIALMLKNGKTPGIGSEIKSSTTKEINTPFEAINYRKSVVKDHYNLLSLNFKDDFSVEFRVYNDAVAYRFVTSKKGDIVIENETANFNFPANHDAFIPYLWDYRGGEIFNASFESPYTEQKISDFATDSLAILPLMVEANNNKKVVIMEADLEDYPGMYLNLNETDKGFKGVYAKYPLEVKEGGYENMNLIPTKRAGFIAKTNGTRSFPWRVIAISGEDKDLLNNDIVQKLAAPCRIEDPSWIEPGQVAWDWWDDYRITGVDFVAGMNTPTFKYYIDFAAANGAKYIIIDWQWSARFDLNEVNPDVDLEEIIEYGKSNDVGVILWAAWCTLYEQMHEVFPKYAEMGVKGWKIDFIDRDDQLAVASTYEIAKLAAEYEFLVDYHGVFKPTGLQRTYPNVVGYEGVYGLENFKWADNNVPRYAVTIPFIRNMAGPMDYTSGSMRNVTDADFSPRNHAPMSKGTRCNQIAQYVVFEVPLQMLSDSPTLYYKEQESTDFITEIPATFDETVALDGEVGEYVAVARQKGETWFVGAMTNWNARELTIDCSFLDEGTYNVVIFQDGVNANTQATDYKKVIKQVKTGESLNIEMANGGGWAARFEKQ
ncbi:MAG: glycoside hydrolase family 97 protein [Prolixibacteraceae bacterium]|jgi:alpha-glucosidase|nr:glycoside hydrolase family 97 protein [Prolixibacteraceae bacterium]